MRSDALNELLERASHRLGLRPRGFANFYGTLRKRIRRRAKELGVDGIDPIDAYARWLDAHDDEWMVFDEICRITISRLYRDGSVMEVLARDVLPNARRVWSAGCASGEEPYTIALLAPHVEIVATDVDAALLARGRRGDFGESSLRELPAELRGRLARECDDLRSRITFLAQDLRRENPDGPFDVVLCRNVAFTYFAEPLQRDVLARIERVLAPGGVLVIGKGESLPARQPGSTPLFVKAASSQVYSAQPRRR